jgi:hypothetical protein
MVYIFELILMGHDIFFELILMGHDIFLKKNTAVQYESEDE